MKFRAIMFLIQRLPTSEVPQANRTLYAEFADEDRNLAEEGMTEYVEGLAKEDENVRPEAN